MKILVVEDEPGIASFLKQGLEEENFSTDIATDGIKGLALALTGNYDLLLLDWMLPGLSGIEICEQFRSKFKKTPVIFLTAKDTIKETITGLQSGANDYIKKPFHFEELLERIKVQMRSMETEDEICSLGTITLDLNTHQVFKENKEIHLTQKEFALLCYLIKNKGKICERSQIIENVWDIHFDYDTGVIDVYVSAIRKKLNLSAEQDYIQTVRGIGYIAKEI
ncbi:MAG: response regulator transcription factor [Flavobacteriaceae bacterium]|nr:response regulator transcription factor [Flavobacteriaceae bacterium]